jgi:hypothetical protein
MLTWVEAVLTSRMDFLMISVYTSGGYVTSSIDSPVISIVYLGGGRGNLLLLQGLPAGIETLLEYAGLEARATTRQLAIVNSKFKATTRSLKN